MTPHIEASPSQIAPTVLMPGDPLRAKFIAEQYLENTQLVSQVRNMLAFTGTYQGKPVTVMGSGMGMASMGIYSWELFNHYPVERIIRVGSCGAYTLDLKLFDLILAESAYSESTYARVQNGSTDTTNFPSATLNNQLKENAANKQLNLTTGSIHSSDVFYMNDRDYYKQVHQQHNVLAVEMEAFALFHNARECGKEAACVLTVSDILPSGEAATSRQRELAFSTMIELALSVV